MSKRNQQNMQKKAIRTSPLAFNEVLARLPGFTREQKTTLVKALFAEAGEVLYTADDLKSMIDTEVERVLRRQQQPPTGPKIINGIARAS